MKTIFRLAVVTEYTPAGHKKRRAVTLLSKTPKTHIHIMKTLCFFSNQVTIQQPITAQSYSLPGGKKSDLCHTKDFFSVFANLCPLKSYQFNDPGPIHCNSGIQRSSHHSIDIE
ncbi:MAG: hypothetical protein KF852_13525 [Saprospiraceae bacterium]|nr:hypothetical protein [Saprospiraceae bacterium]